MLPLGRVGKHFGQERDTRFTREEQKTMMTLWCIFGSPLMLGAEMTMLDEWTLSLLRNEELLRLENGRFVSRQVLRDREKCVWCAVQPQTGEYYVALFKLSDGPQHIPVSLEECGAMFPDDYQIARNRKLKDVWSGKVYGDLSGEVPAHGTLLIHTQF